MNEHERAILRISEDPRLTSGERMRKIAALTGTQFHPAGPSYREITERATTASKARRSR